jgi:hypothetical protein
MLEHTTVGEGREPSPSHGGQRRLATAPAADRMVPGCARQAGRVLVDSRVIDGPRSLRQRKDRGAAGGGDRQ